MIKLFRNIRRSLIQENKMGKYFKYAIGEILLVVIGILIALQINNWNELRKERQKEKAFLKEINLDDNIYWFHCASLGELEQAKPVIEKIKFVIDPKLLLKKVNFHVKIYKIVIN